jgi:uncharacterized membrane protein YdjX (TVP38/TMEM64 family)
MERNAERTERAMAEPASAGTDSRLASGGWRGLLRFLPVALVVGGLAAGYALGLDDYLSLKALADSRDALIAGVEANRIAAGLVYMVAYATAIACAFPAASILTIAGGFLFGWLAGGTMTVVAATLGATAIFLAARTALGDILQRRAGPRIERLGDGFRQNAFSYLLILRLAPIFPFFIVNIAPAFFRVPTRIFVAATFIGILPGTFVYAYLGAGIGSVLDAAAAAGREVSPAEIVTPEITAAFFLLAALAAAALILKKWWAGRSGGAAAARPVEDERA